MKCIACLHHLVTHSFPDEFIANLLCNKCFIKWGRDLLHAAAISLKVVEKRILVFEQCVFDLTIKDSCLCFGRVTFFGFLNVETSCVFLSRRAVHQHICVQLPDPGECGKWGFFFLRRCCTISPHSLHMHAFKCY